MVRVAIPWKFGSCNLWFVMPFSRECGGIGSDREIPLEFHSSERAGNNGPGGRKSDRKRSDRVENEGSARRVGLKAARRKRPYLENSTACQKSTPNVDTPSIRILRLVEVPLGKNAVNTSEDAVHEVGYSADCRAALSRV